MEVAEEQRTLMRTPRQRQQMVRTCVTLRLITKESNRRANERKEKPDRPREMLLDWLAKTEYKMDYTQLKRMAEDRTEWRL